MDINGCRIIAKLHADGDEGFIYTVSRIKGSRKWPNPIPEDAVFVDRGPFLSQAIAGSYAQSWSNAETPPPMPLVVTSKVVDEKAPEPTEAVIDTASANEVKQVEVTVETPPCNEPKQGETPASDAPVSDK